jgi:hypothetical protein
MTSSEYIPGVCNIGPQEVAVRRTVGWVSLAIFVVLLVVLVRSGVNPLWRLFVFFPAMMSASGFLQAHFHFCSGYALRGMFNFGSLGQGTKVPDATSKMKDKSKGSMILLYSILIGIAAAIISMVV